MNQLVPLKITKINTNQLTTSIQVNCDLKEIKEITIQIKANQSKDSITYGRHLHKLKQRFDANTKEYGMNF
jgi:hypothetical protein